MIHWRVVLACVVLAACGGDDVGEDQKPSATSQNEDAGPGGDEHSAGHGGSTASTGSNSIGAAKGGSGSPNSAAAGRSAPAQGGIVARDGGHSGRAEAGSGGEAGRQKPGRSRPEAGSGGEAGPQPPGRDRPEAGSGGRMATGQECPGMQPEEGSDCAGLEGMRCNYGNSDCRCKNSEPVWSCEAAKGGGHGQPKP